MVAGVVWCGVISTVKYEKKKSKNSADQIRSDQAASGDLGGQEISVCTYRYIYADSQIQLTQSTDNSMD